MSWAERAPPEVPKAARCPSACQLSNEKQKKAAKAIPNSQHARIKNKSQKPKARTDPTPTNGCTEACTKPWCETPHQTRFVLLLRWHLLGKRLRSLTTQPTRHQSHHSFSCKMATRARRAVQDTRVDLHQLQQDTDDGPNHLKRKWAAAIGPVSKRYKRS